MNYLKACGIVSLFVLCCSIGLKAADVDTKGAKMGVWTMDLDAAKSLSKKSCIPLLINFTGSDWCGWCKAMDKSVFATPEWQSFAKENLALAYIDFPQDKSLVPEKYVERNEELKAEFSVRGYPTYVVIDNDGTELGRLGAGQNKKPSDFITEFKALCRYRAASIEEYAKTLDAKGKKTYLAVTKKIIVNGKRVGENQKTISKLDKENSELTESIEEAKIVAQEFRVAQLGKDEMAKYKKLKVDLKNAEKKLNDWIATKPKRNAENGQKFQAMRAEIDGLNESISSY